MRRDDKCPTKQPDCIGDGNPTPLYPGESRQIVDEVETSAMKVEQVAYAGGLCIARHFHETASLLYIITGVHWSGYSRGGDTCLPYTVRFLPAGEPHENYFPVQSRCLHAELRPSIFQLAAEYGRTITSPGQVTGARATRLGEQLHRVFSQQDDDSVVDIQGVILQILLLDERDSRKRRERIPHWLLQLREMLREELTCRPNLTDLSRSVGRHPVQISRQFQQYFGCTMGDYLRRVRIARAQSLLTRPELDISQIALDCGFCDQSHFTRAFHKVTGRTPYRYRLLVSPRMGEGGTTISTSPVVTS